MIRYFYHPPIRVESRFHFKCTCGNGISCVLSCADTCHSHCTLSGDQLTTILFVYRVPVLCPKLIHCQLQCFKTHSTPFFKFFNLISINCKECEVNFSRSNPLLIAQAVQYNDISNGSEYGPVASLIKTRNTPSQQTCVLADNPLKL